MTLKQALCVLATTAALLAPAAARAATITVPAGGNLQAAINAALPGDTVALQPGAVFIGPFKLPVKSGTATITIRSAAPDSALPPAGTRITPSYAAQLPKITSSTAGPAIAMAAGAGHWRFLFLEFRPGSATSSSNLLELGNGSASTLGAVPHDIVVDRCYLHGDPSYGQRRGLALNSSNTQVLNSYFADFKMANQDTQAIAGWDGPGPFLIENNYIEAAAENIMFGGTDPRVPNLIPSDITIRRNHITKPLAWMSQSWTIKNLIEFKNAQRVLVEGNTIENNWAAGQQGYSILMTPRNQSGTAPWSAVRDITVQNNVIRHVAAVFNVFGHDNLATSQQTENITIRNNLAYDISYAYGIPNHPAPSRFVLILADPKNVTIAHNTSISDAGAIFIDGGSASTAGQVVGFVFDDNIAYARKYPVYGNAIGEGTKGLAYYAPNYEFLGNVIGKYSTAAYPAGTDMLSFATLAAQFVNFAGDDYRLASTAIVPHTTGVDFTALNAAMNMPSPAVPPPPPPPPPPPTGSTPYTGTPIALPTLWHVENYDKGGEGIAYHDTTAGNSGGQYRTDGVDIQVTTDSGGGYDIGWVKATEWLNYTVNVATAGTYSLDVRVASNGAGGTFHLEANGKTVTGTMTVPNTGGWQVWRTLTTSMTLGSGKQIVRLVMDTNGASGSVGNFNWLRVR